MRAPASAGGADVVADAAGAHAPRDRRRSRVKALVLSVALLLDAPSVGRATAEPVPALAGLTTIGVDVELHPSQESLSSRELASRIEGRLRAAAPGLTLDPASPSRLRLTVLVRPYSATALRGFWLPFSGTYGIGPVRLSVERTAAVAGVFTPLSASVWHVERQAAGPWRESPSEIFKLLDQALEDFLDAYRR